MDAKDGARERLEGARKGLVELSHRIHAHPELGFEEEKSSTWIAEALADAGFKVERGVCGMPTAFIARAGSGPLHLAFAPNTIACRESATPAATISLLRSQPARVWRWPELLTTPDLR